MTKVESELGAPCVVSKRHELVPHTRVNPASTPSHMHASTGITFSLRMDNFPGMTKPLTSRFYDKRRPYNSAVAIHIGLFFFMSTSTNVSRHY